MARVRVADLIGRLYGAVGRPELWQPWFEELCVALGVPTGAMTLRFEWGVGHQGHFAVGIPDEFHGLSYASQLVDDLPIYARVLTSEPGTFLILSEPESDFLASRFYNEWMRPQGLRHLLGGIVYRTPKHVTGMGFIRRHDQRRFGARELDLLHRLAPHLQRAIHVQEMLVAAELKDRAADQALDALRLAAALVDEDAVLLAMNARAEALFEEDAGIRHARNRLTAERPEETRELRRLVSDATRDAGGRGGTLAVSRGDDHSPLMTFVSPLRPAAAPSPWHERRTAIVLMSDPEELPQLPEAGLRRLYGLTPAEARVASRVAQGQRLEEIAESFAVQPSTVRTQLQQVFAKTGTQRQSELVRLLLSGPGAIRATR